MNIFLSFHWLSVLNLSHVWQNFFVLVSKVLVTFALKMGLLTFVTIQPDLNRKEARINIGTVLWYLYYITSLNSVQLGNLFNLFNWSVQVYPLIWPSKPKRTPNPPKRTCNVFLVFILVFLKKKKTIIHTCVRTIFYNAVAKLI